MTAKMEHGFFDLDCFDLTKKERAACERLQKFLKRYQDTADYQRKYNRVQWEKAKNIAAQLQQFLLSRLRAEKEI